MCHSQCVLAVGDQNPPLKLVGQFSQDRPKVVVRPTIPMLQCGPSKLPFAQSAVFWRQIPHSVGTAKVAQMFEEDQPVKP